MASPTREKLQELPTAAKNKRQKQKARLDKNCVDKKSDENRVFAIKTDWTKTVSANTIQVWIASKPPVCFVGRGRRDPDLPCNPLDFFQRVECVTTVIFSFIMTLLETLMSSSNITGLC